MFNSFFRGVLTVLVVATLCGTATAQRAARRQLPRPVPVPPDEYVVDFVSTAAYGVGLNRYGDVTGRSYDDPGCGSFCLANLQTVVWRGGERIVLPGLGSLPGITVVGINDDAWAVGFAGFLGTTTHAVLWKPIGSTYEVVDLGTLPGTTISTASGIDNQGRVVGWSTTSNFPPVGSPFLWTEAGGMIDLSLQGAPDERPLAISPGGTVATATGWYRLNDPGTFFALPASPPGFLVGNEPTAINDAGDQARFLISTSTQNLRYLFRFHHEGTWQLLSSSPTGQLTPYGMGSINAARDVTATVTGSAVIAYGPGGLAQSLTQLVSPAYPGSTATSAGPINARGEILARVFVGLSPRLVRLQPVRLPAASGIVVNELTINAIFVPDPNDPTQDHCSQTLNAYNAALVTVRVTMPDAGSPEGVQVSGRFLDDYWMNQPVSGTTDANGVVSFSHTGLCGVGAIAFLVDSATNGVWSLDRTSGVLSTWAIPH